MKIDNDNTPIVMRGKIKDRTTYARLPIKNKYPLPTLDTHPMEAAWMRLRYAAFCIREQRYEEAHRALFLAADDLESMQFVYMEGGSGAHRNFTDQMAKKTVIARACKIALDSTKDGYKEEAKETMQQHDDDEMIEVVSDSESQPARLEEHHDDFEEAATAATDADTAANSVRACPI